MLDKIERWRIPIESKKLIGIPFKNGGRSRMGLDCLGLIHLVYRHSGGINLPIYEDHGIPYSTDWYKKTSEDRLLNGLLDYFDITDNPKSGDIILFKLFTSLNKIIPYHHCGIWIGKDCFVHVLTGSKTLKGKVELTSLYSKLYYQKQNLFLKYKGIVES